MLFDVIRGRYRLSRRRLYVIGVYFSEVNSKCVQRTPPFRPEYPNPYSRGCLNVFSDFSKSWTTKRSDYRKALFCFAEINMQEIYAEHNRGEAS